MEIETGEGGRDVCGVSTGSEWLMASRAGAGRWTSLSEERGSRESGDVERQDRGRAHVTEKGSRNIRPGERSGLTARAARAPQHLLEVASPAHLHLGETLQEGVLVVTGTVFKYET